MVYQLNRRNFRRCKTSWDCKLAKGTSKLLYIDCLATEVSLGGARIKVYEYLEPFSIVEVKIDVDGSEVDIEGRVIWIVKDSSDEDSSEPYYTIGIQFLNLNTDHDKKLVEVIMKKRRK